MTLRFEVNQAEAFRRGINVPKSTCHLDVDPAELSQEDRDLIADRLDGIDVCKLDKDGDKLFTAESDFKEGARIVANLPSFESLMEAIQENQKQVKRKTDGDGGTEGRPLSWAAPLGNVPSPGETA